MLAVEAKLTHGPAVETVLEPAPAIDFAVGTQTWRVERCIAEQERRVHSGYRRGKGFRSRAAGRVGPEPCSSGPSVEDLVGVIDIPGKLPYKHRITRAI